MLSNQKPHIVNHQSEIKISDLMDRNF